ncbi:MAG: hypothetical protein R2839_11320 [Thermomicrobiales bacterium]
MRFVGEGQLGAGNRENAGIVRCFGELHRSIETIVIGDCQRLVPQFQRTTDHLLSQRGAIQKRERGVEVEFGVHICLLP